MNPDTGIALVSGMQEHAEGHGLPHTPHSLHSRQVKRFLPFPPFKLPPFPIFPLPPSLRPVSPQASDSSAPGGNREGEFIEKINHAIVPCIDNGKIIEFLFRDLKTKKWNSIKDNRIGRLLPPYINRIQQRYALYLHREGLPRTPDMAVCDVGYDNGNSC